MMPENIKEYIKNASHEEIQGLLLEANNRLLDFFWGRSDNINRWAAALNAVGAYMNYYQIFNPLNVLPPRPYRAAPLGECIYDR